MLPRSSLRRLCRARDRLVETVEEPLSIHEVAREARVSTGSFIRQFTSVFGETPHQHRIRARVDRARLLLAMGDHSVTQVCMEVGFSSVGSFSTLFARRVGVAPSAYRREVRTLVQVPELLPRVLTPGCFSLMAQAFAGFQGCHEQPRPAR